MLLKPREYQDYAIDQTFDYFHESNGNPLILMPTGVGKSLVCAGICCNALQTYPQTRILMMTHSKELVDQNYKKLKAMWAEAPVGIYCDGLGKKHHHYPITFGTIASFVNVIEIFGYIDFVIVDEAHGIAPKEETMYMRAFNKLREVNPDLKIIGMTATGYRMKQGMLTEGPGALFTDIIVDMTDMESYNWFFDEGYLVPPIPRPTKTEFDLSNVGIRGGEYDQKALNAEVDTDKKNESVVLEMLEHGASRNCGLVFSSGVDHARHLYEIFHYYGERATWVASHGMSDKERDRRIADYQHGEYKWMINNGILTTGFDHPPIDFIGMVKHTLSVGLWIQMLGRGTRPLYATGFDLMSTEGRLNSILASVKQNTMVLDFASNVTRLGHINAPRIPKPSERKRKGDAPIRICDSCGVYCHASATTCWGCGFVFPRMSKFDDKSSAKELVAKVNSSKAPVPEIVLKEKKVDFVTFAIHKKDEKPPTLKVTYHCNKQIYSEWIGFESDHPFARMKAKEWWLARDFLEDVEIPDSTENACERAPNLRQPSSIIVEKVSRQIRDHKFPEATVQNDADT